MLLLLWLACRESPGPARTETPPSNVLLVLLDDISLERVGTYGVREDAIPMPTFDKLAEQGVLFRHAWVEPLCSPTRAALLTGRFPRRTGVGGLIDSWRQGYDLPPNETLIPEMLQRSAVDWDSSEVGKWHLASLNGGDPLADPGEQGFRWWAGSPSNLQDPYQDYLGADRSYYSWLKDDNGEILRRSTYATTDSTDDAIARIGAMTEPWFLYLPYNAAHQPFHAPPSSFGTGVDTDSALVDKYDAMVRVVDAELGRVLASMSDELRARTTVIVLADNGTPSDVIRPPTDPLQAKGSVYEAGVSVPLVITGPYVQRPGSVSDAFVHAVDLFPTIAEIAEVDSDEFGVPIDGQSLLPILRDPGAGTADRLLFAEKFEPNGFGPFSSHTRGLRDQQFKLISSYRRNDSGSLEITEELYDLDRGQESENLRDDPAYAQVWSDLSEELDQLEQGFREEVGDQSLP